MKQMNRIFSITVLIICFAFVSKSALTEGEDFVECANLIYAGTKSSICFSESFLSDVSRETTIRASRKFKPVKLGGAEIFDFPFAVMTAKGKSKINFR